MTKMREAVEQLRARRRESLAMGGQEKIERQHQRGKLTVRERIDLLFDPGTFQEYGLLASHMMHKPGDKPTPADAVVTGFGRIEGRMAGVLAEDFTVLGGSTGATNMCKRLRMMRLATQERVPLVYLLDGGGARAQMLGQFAEGLPIVAQFLKMARLSGVAPQVAVVMGACAGEPALEASLIEFIIMVRGTGMMAAGGPPVVKASIGLHVTKDELGGVDVHCAISGNADNPAENDRDALLTVKRYLSYLPTNAWQYPPYVAPADSPDRREEELLDILPDNPKAAYDMRRVIDCVADRGSFFEIKPLFAPMMITGFARMNGHTIGIIANQPMVNSGAITARAGRKERHFIDLCAAYHVPLLFLVDVPGVMTGPQSEHEAAMRFGLSVAYAMAWADVPKFTVVLRKAFGFGGCAMCGFGAGQTLTLAWPTADFASIPVDSAILSAHGSELAEAEDPEALYKELEARYMAYAGPYPAAGSFNVDDVIDPRDTRFRIIHALEMALNRRTAPPSPTMRHGVMP